MIVRRQRNGRFTVVANHIAEDERLSYEAVGLMTYLLSRPDNWRVHVSQLQSRGGCGRDKTRKLLAELIDAGYITRDQARSDDGRTIAGVVYTVFDEPQRAGQAPENQGLDPQAPDSQGPENQGPENPSAYKRLKDNNTDSQPEREGAREEETEGEAPEGLTRRAEALFYRWFKTWDRFDTSPKPPMLAAWAKLTWAEMEQCGPTVPHFLAQCRRDGVKHACAVSTFLETRMWLAFVERVAQAAAPPERALAKPFGKAWGAQRFAVLLAGREPSALIMAPTATERRMIAAGQLDEAALMHRRFARHAFPTVNGMHERAAAGHGSTVEARFDALGAGFEQVKVGSPRWEEWQAEHDRRGWPWLPDPGRLEWVWFPVGGPPGLAQFEAALQAARPPEGPASEASGAAPRGTTTAVRGHEHDGRSEAAE